MEEMEYGPVIKAIGVGKAGLRALNKIEEADLTGVELIAVDKNGENLTGCKAVNQFTTIDKSDEDIDNLLGNQIKETDLVFVLADMGCEFASVYAEKIANIVKNKSNSLIFSVVSRPFFLEGPKRAKIAETSINKLLNISDSVVVVDNNTLIEEKLSEISLEEAYEISAERIKDTVEAISQIIQVKGVICVDFADIKAIFENSGIARSASYRAEDADITATKVKENLQKELSNKKAENMLVTFIAHRLSFKELNDAMIKLRELVKEEGNIIFNSIFVKSESLTDKIKVSAVVSEGNRNC